MKKLPTIEAEFSKELLAFLQAMNYSHVLCIGASASEDFQEGTKDDYRIIPLKESDPRLKYEEADYIIHAIDNYDTLEMALGDPFIRFLIELPRHEYESFLKTS